VQLSGGEQQRVSLARPSSTGEDPLLRRTTGNLDDETGRRWSSWVFGLNRERGTARPVTHTSIWRGAARESCACAAAPWSATKRRRSREIHEPHENNLTAKSSSGIASLEESPATIHVFFVCSLFVYLVFSWWLNEFHPQMAWRDFAGEPAPPGAVLALDRPRSRRPCAIGSFRDNLREAVADQSKTLLGATWP